MAPVSLMDSENSEVEPTSGSSQQLTLDTRGTINFGQTVLFRLPRGDIKSAVLKQNSYESVYGFPRGRADCLRTVSLGKAGTFHANELIGDPYGLAYEIVGQKIRKLPPKTIQELGTSPSKTLGFCDDPRMSELTEATNELISDDKVVQPLTTAEIEALKQSGVHSTVGPGFHPYHAVAYKPADRKSSRNRSRNMRTSLSRLNIARKSTRSGKKPSAYPFFSKAAQN